MNKIKFMNYAIDQAYEGIEAGHGGPFGCVIVKDGEVVGYGHNEVIKNNDPTCHGEMQAIRSACKHLGTFDLSGCELYTTGKPCPMCSGAIQWARIQKVYEGCNYEDAEDIGFDDKVFFEHPIESETLGRDECKQLYEDYKNTKHKNY